MSIVSGTDHARFERVAPDLLEVRLKPAVHIDEAIIAGIVHERRRLCGNIPIRVLGVVCSDSTLDLGVVGMDHYTNNRNPDGSRAVAYVSGALASETVARLYAADIPIRGVQPGKRSKELVAGTARAAPPGRTKSLAEKQLRVEGWAPKPGAHIQVVEHAADGFGEHGILRGTVHNEVEQPWEGSEALELRTDRKFLSKPAPDPDVVLAKKDLIRPFPRPY